jgi:hypothetical protein
MPGLFATPNRSTRADCPIAAQYSPCERWQQPARAIVRRRVPPTAAGYPPTANDAKGAALLQVACTRGNGSIKPRGNATVVQKQHGASEQVGLVCESERPGPREQRFARAAFSRHTAWVPSCTWRTSQDDQSRTRFLNINTTAYRWNDGYCRRRFSKAPSRLRGRV